MTVTVLEITAFWGRCFGRAIIRLSPYQNTVAALFFPEPRARGYCASSDGGVGITEVQNSDLPPYVLVLFFFAREDFCGNVGEILRSKTLVY